MSHLLINLSTNWKSILQEIFNKNVDKTDKLFKFLDTQKEQFDGLASIFPPEDMIFNAFNHFNFEDLKVIIIGQDPYHQKGQAMGLSFSVPENIKIPPSLKNIIKEIKSNCTYVDQIDKEITNGDLTYLAKQGVLLLNKSLTVREYAPNSHKLFWKYFTDELLKYIVKNSKQKIFLLWGNEAKGIKKEFIKCNIDFSKHYFLEAAHPSPLSANKGGWFSCNHFKKTNNILTSLNKSEINWIN